MNTPIEKQARDSTSDVTIGSEKPRIPYAPPRIFPLDVGSTRSGIGGGQAETPTYAQGSS